MTCPHAVRPALVLPENLHCRVLIVRGCSFAHRPNGWCAAGEVSSKRCPDSASISSNALASYLQPFTHASNFCKVLLLLESFFFSSRRRHTRLTCDWSSDVCSSD